jgi:FkbM family methyltransferase
MRGLKFSGGESPGWVLGASEPAVQNVLVQQLAPGDVFYDVGANVGFFSLLAAKLVGSTGRVYCFEPQPSVIAQLRANLDRNGFTNYEVIEAAVADQRGTARLRLGRGDPWSELTARLVDGDGGGTLAVDVVALDDLDLPAPRLVKIDVEGAESRVLAGMTRLLREHRPILVIELHGTQEPVTRLLRESDYRVEMLFDPGGVPHGLATPA